MKRLLTITLVLGLSILFFSGCALKRTELQVDEAKMAVEQARAAGAEENCPQEFQEVLELWQEAQALSPCNGEEATQKAAAVKQRANQLCTDSDGDGVPDERDLCPETPAGTEVDENGCALKPEDSDQDGVNDDMDRCPDTPRGAIVDDMGCWVIGSVYFDLDEHVIKPQYTNLLDEAVAVMQRNPEVDLSIQGHTDSIASNKYNRKLSEQRAEEVKQYFIQKGIATERLKTKSFGERRPKASNLDADTRALNRRVELHPNW